MPRGIAEYIAKKTSLKSQLESMLKIYLTEETMGTWILQEERVEYKPSSDTNVVILQQKLVWQSFTWLQPRGVACRPLCYWLPVNYYGRLFLRTYLYCLGNIEYADIYVRVDNVDRCTEYGR